MKEPLNDGLFGMIRNLAFSFGDSHLVPAKWLWNENSHQVLLMHDNDLRLLSSILHLTRTMRNCIIVYGFSWFRNLTDFRQIKEQLDESISLFPDVDIQQRLLLLLNSRVELAYARYALPRFDSILCSNNAFINVNEFHPLPDTEKIFDAVMNAKLRQWKRHLLAEDVERIAYISYDVGNQDAIIRSSSACAHYRGISAPEINLILNKSWCGLALSEAEGACYASTEYLLAGLPVVSTQSFGGRSEFYDANNSLIVQSDRNEVFAAVNLIKKRLQTGQCSPQALRIDTIRKITRFRKNLVLAINNKCATMGLYPHRSKAIEGLFDKCHHMDQHFNRWASTVGTLN